VNLRAPLAAAAKQSVKAAAAGIDLARPVEPGVTILIYHRVGAGSGGEMDLDPAVFDRQLAWLRQHQRIITLDRALEELASTPRGGPGPTGVVLTFDDGTADWVDQVLPALDRHGAPATFYVSTDFVERGVPFPGEGTPISWNGLREMASSPLVTIGSHTHRHLLMDRLAPAAIDEELDRSIELLGDRVGVDATHFCYPKAVAGSAAAESAVRARFRSATVGGTRPNHPGVDPYRLRRSPIQRSDGTAWFRRKANGGMRAEDDVRQGINRLRYRALSS
jgi:peptidoglycan/xylan/chitin deacetylase (PgdA/CDA1 family)